ncbi:heat-inducible transcriptional repressor HrcA [Micrococcus porci]|uniref:heat-inducible transcriptional repressor HrcA n=1 Tax=Micrococcus TaxID=1269 RepID=UPI001CCC29EC|nr:heat-inducible transcriptional repressor HrcA [Micrococcus porci]MCG7421261.1 heat-inducible transcriptional repressor HrcA [Micrococcus sp. ACRRV]UBH23817.1 heat-inducible transcriptional repressor HrcA [Micrococcus porci]
MTEQPRRLQVLQAIVEDYVSLREPVGSKALVERHALGVSSATVRNDMAALEEEGLIVAPHTSAGRVPTDKGYRVFVDRISEVKPLSAAERRAVRTLLDSEADTESMMEATVRLLAQLTRQVAVVQFPHEDGSTVRHLDLVALTPERVLVVLILSTGRIEQRTVALARPVQDEDLAALRAVLLPVIEGLGPAQAAAVLDTPLEGLPPARRAAAVDVVGAVRGLLEAERQDRIVLAGTANLARSTDDFHSSIGPILEALEEQVVLLRLLTEMGQDAHGVSVRIGAENGASLADTSVVAAAYGPGAVAKVGVIGPTRMDYPGTMAAVRAIARYLSRILTT